MFRVNAKIFNREYDKYLNELIKIGEKYRLPEQLEQYAKERKYITKTFVKRVLYKSIEQITKEEINTEIGRLGGFTKDRK